MRNSYLILSLFLMGIQIHSSLASCPSVRVTKVLLNETEPANQYVEYVTQIPDLNELTLGFWFHLLRSASEAPLFTYVAGDSHVKAALTQEGELQSLTLHVNDVLISNVKVSKDMHDDWHHVLYSWHGATGTWSVFLDGALLEGGNISQSEGLLVRGGGRAFSGHDPSRSTRNLTSKGESGTERGFSAWVTLLFLDTSAIEDPTHWLNRLAVELVASKCITKHGGDIISWQDTPRRSYGGVMEAVASDLCT